MDPIAMIFGTAILQRGPWWRIISPRSFFQVFFKYRVRFFFSDLTLKEFLVLMNRAVFRTHATRAFFYQYFRIATFVLIIRWLLYKANYYSEILVPKIPCYTCAKYTPAYDILSLCDMTIDKSGDILLFYFSFSIIEMPFF